MTLISVEHLSKSYQSHSLMGAGKAALYSR
ncbi:Uncharacterised protein [Morganella morganii]|nr:Uncharacterised protein [Morganella morganii]